MQSCSVVEADDLLSGATLHFCMIGVAAQSDTLYRQVQKEALSVANNTGAMANMADALTKGYTATFGVGAQMLLPAALVMAMTVNTRQTQHAHAVVV